MNIYLKLPVSILNKRKILNTHKKKKQGHISNSKIKAGVGFDSHRSINMDSLTIKNQTNSDPSALVTPGEVWRQAGWCTYLLTACGARYAGRALSPSVK